MPQTMTPLNITTARVHILSNSLIRSSFIGNIATLSLNNRHAIDCRFILEHGSNDFFLAKPAKMMLKQVNVNKFWQNMQNPNGIRSWLNSLQGQFRTGGCKVADTIHVRE